MWNTKSEPTGNRGLCVIKTCHWMLINRNEHIPVVHGVPGGEISVPVPSTQFCCEPKPAPKIRLFFFLKQGLSNRYLVQFSHSVVSDSATPWTAAHQASLSISNSRDLLKLMSVASVMPSNHLILYRPLLLPPSIFPSIRVFSNESVLHIRWPKYWSFSFSISPSSEYSELISCKIDWLDLLAVQGTLKSLLQYHSSKASILRHSAFFIV